MAYAVADEQSILRDSVDRFLADNYTFEKRRAIVAGRNGFSQSVWQAFADMGLLAAPFGPEFGGAGNFLDIVAIMEAFGRALVVEPYLPTVILAGGLLRRAGTPDSQDRIRQIATGKAIYAVAFSEPGSRFNLADVSLTATPDGDAFRLSGRKCVVYGAPAADTLIVTARTSGGQRDEHGVTLFMIDPGAAGLQRTDYPTTDGMRASDLTLDNVRVPKSAVIGGMEQGLPLLSRVIDEATVALCAEAVGAMGVLNEKTREHCLTRVAFGGPLARMQVIQHRLVDMLVAEAHAQALTLKAGLEFDRPDAEFAGVASAAKFQVGLEASMVAKSAVQLHGAMGITDELDVSHYFRRLTTIGSLFGGGDHHIRRYIRLAEPSAPANGPDAVAAAIDTHDLTPEDSGFRDRIRRFYEENLTDELRRAAEYTLHMSPFEQGRKWQRILYQHGFGATNWPSEFGGCNWTPIQHMIWEAESARAGPPQTMGMGKGYCGPCVIKFGTQAQKDYFLPRILSGEDWWAQGYSEPGAGSDLASLQLNARSDGDDYVLNGSKIWTTFAHHANRIFCLTRTATGDKKQFGITFLLIDMNTPGIEIRPIPNMAGDHDFNQVFFTDVRVPKSRRLGEENGGWTVARHLLLYEHGANLSRANLENVRRLGWLREIAALEADGNGGRLADDPDFARRIAEMAIGIQAMDFACRQEFLKAHTGDPPSPRNELLALRSKQIGQSLTELAMEAVGYYGAPFQPDVRKAGGLGPKVGPTHAIMPMPFYLSQRGSTIAGGAPEVHRNNVAKRILHL